MEAQAPAATETNPRSQWDTAIRQFAKRGLILCFLLFVTEVGLLVIISSAPYFFPGEEQFFAGQAKSLGSLVQSSTTAQLAVEIFTNNYKIALEEMIPILGPLLFTLSLYETARVTQAIAVQDGYPAFFLVIELFVLPHSWIELPAYAVATAESVYLTIGIIHRKEPGRLNMEAWQLGINIIIVTVMLAVAAVFESVEIALETSFVVFLTWIPFVALVIVVLSMNRRLSRIRNEERRQEQQPTMQPVPV